MLGKLIRYDFKVQFQVLSWVYLLGGVFALLAGIFRGLQRGFSGYAILDVLGTMTHVICILAIVIMVVGTAIYTILYFRRNLLRDEGYLMHTLPVSPAQLYLSKLITAFVYILLSVVVAYLCYAIDQLDIAWIKQIEIESGMGKLVGVYVCVMVLGVITSLCQFYASLCAGYTWKLNTASPINKDLLSVIAYIALYMIQQCICMVVLVVWFAVKYFNSSYSMEEIMQMGENTALDFVYGIAGVSGVLTLVTGIALSVFSIWRLHRRLNLE